MKDGSVCAGTALTGNIRKPVEKVLVYGKAEFKIEYDRAGFD